jgi:hypothetical protein
VRQDQVLPGPLLHIASVAEDVGADVGSVTVICEGM